MSHTEFRGRFASAIRFDASQHGIIGLHFLASDATLVVELTFLDAANLAAALSEIAATPAGSDFQGTQY